MTRFSNDDELFEALTDAVRTLDPVPERVTSFGRSAHMLLDLEAELAELVTDRAEPMLVRSASATHTAPEVLEYRVGDIVIELEIDREVIGMIEPVCRHAELVLLGDGGSTTQPVAVAAVGTFRFDRPSQPFRLRFSVGDRIIRTPVIS